MNIIALTPWDLGLAALLVVGTAGLSFWQGVGIGGQILVAALRTVLQLALVGVVLKALFANVHPGWMALMATVMLLVAGREIRQRQQRPLAGWWGFGVGTVAAFLSSFAVTVLALTLFVSPTPWYTPQYAIPLLGMVLGNTMSAISLAMDRLTHGAARERAVIEARLTLGQSWHEALAPLTRTALHTGLTPIINAMATAGVVNLPGMMTGQILGGNPPMVAVAYQILIMFLLTGSAGIGTTLAVWMAGRRLFDQRQRLRLDRLR